MGVAEADHKTFIMHDGAFVGALHGRPSPAAELRSSIAALLVSTRKYRNPMFEPVRRRTTLQERLQWGATSTAYRPAQGRVEAIPRTSVSAYGCSGVCVWYWRDRLP